MKVTINGQDYDLTDNPAARELLRMVGDLDRENATLRAAVARPFQPFTLKDADGDKPGTVQHLSRSIGPLDGRPGRVERLRVIEIIEEVL